MTMTTGRLQLARIAHLNKTAVHPDGPLILQHTQARGDARASDSEQPRQHVVGNRKLVFVERELRQKKPASESLLKTMMGIASSRLRGLQQDHRSIAQQELVERRTQLARFQQILGGDSQRRAADLHDAAKGWKFRIPEQ